MRLSARSVASFCLAVAALAATASPVAAKDKWKDLLGRPGGGQGLEQGMVDRSRYEGAQADGMSLDRAVDMVQKRFNARVVRLDRGQPGASTSKRNCAVSPMRRVGSLARRAVCASTCTPFAAA